MESFEEFTSTAEQWIRLNPFLRWVDEDALDFDYGLLDDATVVIAEPGNPYAVINHHVERIRELDEGHFLLPYTGLHATEVAHESIVDREGACELVVAPSVMETIQTNEEYTTLFEGMVATGRFDVYQASTELPLSVGVLDDYVQIIAADGEQPRALIETTQSEVYEWATGVFETYKRQAELTMSSSTSEITLS
ncbi:hypothetical protein K933_17027 [Candidatus Halobonum tyrrellensis G22]|uniref:Methanogenesis regulatory protein FilR1 middle domain-containing protein n=1 Tax=Candidatus Halobonum tyrrellensis G22 TaxID=1324957 RepID=V4IUF7_9EURY|nr:hypothetical protein [Candidatus Halobonum tyrrellensis]ESP86807.1 hypothetical protein K933_17027 [Candidatus Halobonum tyrrellensis G22]